MIGEQRARKGKRWLGPLPIEPVALLIAPVPVTVLLVGARADL